ncbi:hypothetical protein OG735_17545 [Streptomyces sp. NBC_01210]|uniref:DUF6668 family protein n=1 Tax=Streptomyces sp. NBC_01210 TaxID=2903774 RepID=UPI002E1465F8|nr:hypothetical protein OG735_17545 [Streptomyces sp. NBC_01210]
MSVPSAAPTGPQMWVRGPTSQQPAGEQTAPAPTGPPQEVAERAPYAQQPEVLDRPTVMMRPVSTEEPGDADRGGHPDPQQQPRQPQRPGRTRQRALSGEGVGWVGAHGGAGASTLAKVLGGTDIGCRWPDASRGEPARVMLVARTHADGMRAASRALDALREGRHPKGMELVALVLVADAPGRLPFPLARRVRVLRSVAPVRRVSWIPAWRMGKQTKNLPKEVFRLGALAGTRPAEAGEPR